MARPKEFDQAAALETAMEVFWTRGYEATTMGDLRKAIGIGRQSLYDTFGDKEQLFAAALDQHLRQRVALRIEGQDVAWVLLHRKHLAERNSAPLLKMLN